jgi:hypothetical protein
MIPLLIRSTAGRAAWFHTPPERFRIPRISLSSWLHWTRDQLDQAMQ